MKQLRKSFLLLHSVLFCLGTSLAAQSSSSTSTNTDSTDLYFQQLTKEVQTLNNAASFRDAKDFVDSIASTGLKINFAPYHVASGNAYFNTGNYFQAVYCYRRAQAPGASFGALSQEYIDVNKSMSILNMGASYQRLGMLDSALACYTRTPITEKNKELLTINIASILINQKEFEKAVDFMEGIDLSQIDKMDYVQLMKSNLMYCYMQLGLLEKANMLFSKEMELYFPYQDSVSTLLKVLDYYIITDDTSKFIRLVDNNLDLWERWQSDYSELPMILNMSKVYKKNNRLFIEGWNILKDSRFPRTIGKVSPTDWFTLKIFWKNLSSAARREMVYIAALAMLLFFALGYATKRLQTRAKSKAHLEANPESTGQNNRSLEEEDPLTKMTTQEQAFISELSLKETQVLRAILLSKSAKEISDELNCSMGYVYNMRSSIRKKFEISFDGMEFEEWLKFKL